MSETTIEATPVAEKKESALKRFAKAFYAKVKAAKDRVVAFFGEHETPVREDEGAVRKVARVALSVPKWIGNGVTGALRVAMWAVGTVVGVVVLAIAAVTLFAYALLVTAAMAVLKVVQFFSLVLRTPYLIVRGDDCLKTDWVGYGNLWKPKYFYLTRISQVFEAQAKQEAKDLADEVWEQATEQAPEETPQPALSVVSDRTKHEPTPKQEKHRPAKIPAMAGAEA